MKCLVAVKRVIDPYVTIRVKTDNSAVETNNVKMAINPFDEIAVEEAVKQKEAGFITEITAISIGSKACQETLLQAMARGADKGFLVETEQSLQPLAIAKILAAIAVQQQTQIIMLGKQAIDDDCNQTGQMLAAILGWGQATFASKIEFDILNKTVTVTREIDSGLETLILNLPVVITTDLRLNEPSHISLPKVMQAKNKPLTIQAITEFDLNLTQHIQITKTEAPPPRKPGVKLSSVPELITKLKSEAKVI